MKLELTVDIRKLQEAVSCLSLLLEQEFKAQDGRQLCGVPAIRGHDDRYKEVGVTDLMATMG